jgi:hypothetical protein
MEAQMITQTLTRRMLLPSLPLGEFGVGLLILILMAQ